MTLIVVPSIILYIAQFKTGVQTIAHIRNMLGYPTSAGRYTDVLVFEMRRLSKELQYDAECDPYSGPLCNPLYTPFKEKNAAHIDLTRS